MSKLDSDKLKKYIRRHPDATQKQIATHFGCTQTLVYYILKHHDIPYKKKNKNSKIQPNMLRKYVNKYPLATQQQIADHFGCNQTAVGDALKRYGIPYKLKCRHKIRRRNYTEIPREELRKYVRDHPEATQGQIAARFGRDQSSISDALKRYDIPYERKDRRSGKSAVDKPNRHAI